MKRIIVLLIIIFLFSCGSQSSENGKTVGLDKWKYLDEYIKSKKTFSVAPSGDIHFDKGNELYFFTEGLDSDKTKGIWRIDFSKGSILIKIPGTIDKVYRNYLIDCYEENNKQQCQLLLIYDKSIPTTKKEIYFNSNNLILSP